MFCTCLFAVNEWNAILANVTLYYIWSMHSGILAFIR